MDAKHRFLAWFLGPKAEQGDRFEQAIVSILRDYVHWRRNYHPADRAITTQAVQHELVAYHDALQQETFDLSAGLRRNFPFYSPRYLAHQLSDTSMPGVIGAFAGLLYNPNNVTPEAAPVTVQWEIEACAAILTMLGLNPPPSVPQEPNWVTHYEAQLKREFGWAHITSGGTLANVEALWAARAVRYFPLGVRDVAICHDLTISIDRPRTLKGVTRPSRDIRKLPERRLLLMRPNDAIYLHARFVDAVRAKWNLDIQGASERARELLEESPLGLSAGGGSLFSKYPPVLYATGAAHYSVGKAADVLGIGRRNVVQVAMDGAFRMRIDSLEGEIRSSIREGKVPLAVVAVVGTTEEGAVDPVHEIADLRQRLEATEVGSFWLHVDAAWAGFLKVLFTDGDAYLDAACEAFGRNYLDYPSLQATHDALAESLIAVPSGGHGEDVSSRIVAHVEELGAIARRGVTAEYADQLEHVLRDQQLKANLDMPVVTPPTMSSRIELVHRYVESSRTLSRRAYRKPLKLQWGYREVCNAIVAVDRADSVTVDPHKMNYLPYPCGVAAYRNDRVRDFLWSEAPYIPGSGNATPLRMPPMAVTPESFSKPDVPPTMAISSFGEFILEGSKPGFAAASLRLSMRTIQLDMKGLGSVIRASLLSARELHAWLDHWDQIANFSQDTDYSVVPLTRLAPDTNIVTFVVKKRTSTSLRAMNELTDKVYERFSIRSALGQHGYSYGQPYFLSHTTIKPPKYSIDMLDDFMARCGLRRHEADYKKVGVSVLRATVMNPYIDVLADDPDNVIARFMEELAQAASEGVKSIS